MMTPPLHPRLASFARIAGRTAAWLAMAFSGTALSHAQTPQPVIIADFNHDGIPDVLVPSTTTPTATIAFGAVPYGTFSAGARAVTFPVACTSFPQGSLLAGDFNNDGLADIAFLCGGTSGVMLGNGDGTFGTPKLLDAPYSQLAVLGDFNKDGKLDIALFGVAGDSVVTQFIQLFAGNGDGAFTSAGLSTLTQQGYSAPVAVDIDGDTYPDIVLGSFSTDSDSPPSVNVFANNKNGTFGTSYMGFNSPNVTVNVSISAASSLLAGNFFGNDVNDLIVPDTGSSPGLLLIQNTSSPGSFSLADPSKTTVAGLTAASPGFFSGNGATDLVIANGTSISVLDNDGSGNFASDYTTLTIPSTNSLFAVADANGDGYSDVFTATNTSGALSLAVNITTGSATATSQPFSLSAGTRNVSAAWNGNVNLLASTATGQQIVDGAATLTRVGSSKNPSTAGDSVTFTVAPIPVLTVEGVPTGSVILMDGTTMLSSGTLISGSYTYTTSTLSVGTHSITAVYSGDSYFAASTSSVLSQVVNHAPGVATVGATLSAPPTVTPGSQTSITVTLTKPYPTDLTGTLTIGFARAGTPQLTDPSLQFAAGGTSLSFTIPANTTTIPPIQLQAGTIAGTITVPLTLTSDGVSVTPADLAPATIVVPPAVPSVSGMTITRSENQLTVVMHGFSNTREVGVATFHFTAAPGATVGTPDLTLPVTAIFNTGWFDTAESDAYGSTFTYTQIFNTSDGAANIGSVDATLTNSVGASTSITAK